MRSRAVALNRPLFKILFMNLIHLASVVNNLELTATVPMEMVNAQQQLITWCDGKLKALRFESNELKGATEHAKQMKWKSATLQNQYNKSLRKISFYEKMKAALLEGFYIVPNFPIQMFAIKTKKKFVYGHSWSYWGEFEQNAQELAQGEGEYKNPFPIVSRVTSEHKDGKEIRKAESEAVDWDEFEFPLTMARPQIMEATSRAMALKIFDRIGIMPAHKKDDPVIIGQIFNKNGWNEKIVSFMIAWHLNTNVL